MISQRVQSMLRMTMADMADAADALDGAFRLENADTYLTPPAHVLEATRDAVGVDDCNSYLPLRGLRVLREAIAPRYGGSRALYDPEGEIVISCGAGESLLNALLTLIDPGDKVLLTNPTYSGMAQRVRLAGGVQVFTPLVHRGRALEPRPRRACARRAGLQGAVLRLAVHAGRDGLHGDGDRGDRARRPPRTTPGSSSTATPTRSRSTAGR